MWLWFSGVDATHDDPMSSTSTKTHPSRPRTTTRLDQPPTSTPLRRRTRPRHRRELHPPCPPQQRHQTPTSRLNGKLRADEVRNVHPCGPYVVPQRRREQRNSWSPGAWLAVRKSAGTAFRGSNPLPGTQHERPRDLHRQATGSFACGPAAFGGVRPCTASCSLCVPASRRSGCVAPHLSLTARNHPKQGCTGVIMDSCGMWLCERRWTGCGGRGLEVAPAGRGLICAVCGAHCVADA